MIARTNSVRAFLRSRKLFACLVLREHQKKSYRGIEDSEANHCIAQEGMGIRAIIPPDTGRPTDKPPSTPYRREMRERFDSGADKGTCGQRWQVETVNSMIKRNLGSALRAKSAGRRSMELLLRCVTHNIMVLEGTQH